jgi:hypothetical protein
VKRGKGGFDHRVGHLLTLQPTPQLAEADESQEETTIPSLLCSKAQSLSASTFQELLVSRPHQPGKCAYTSPHKNSRTGYYSEHD